MKRELWLFDDQGKIRRLDHQGRSLEHATWTLHLGSQITDQIEGLPTEAFPNRLGILLSSTLCFWTPLPNKPSGVYTSFDLEESLPLDAEDLHFAHQTDRLGQHAIAISTEYLLPLIQGLEKRDVDIDFIVPISIVQLEHVLRTHSIRSGNVILANEDRFDVFEIDNRKIKNWQVAWSVADVQQKLNQSLTQSPIFCVGTDADQWKLPDATELSIEQEDWLNSLTTTAKLKLLGNLAHGKLESNQRKQAFERSVWNAGVALLLLLMTFAGIAYYQGELERQEAEAIRTTQVRRLRKAFAGMPRRDEAKWLQQEIVVARQALTQIRENAQQPSLLPIVNRALEAFEAQREEQQTLLRLSVDRQKLQVEAVFNNVGRLEEQLRARSFAVIEEGIPAPGKRTIVAIPEESKVIVDNRGKQ